MDKYYVREYIPGYTGHIPKKMDTFAMTAGEINRQLVLKGQTPEVIPDQRLYYSHTPQAPPKHNGDLDKFGFRSRYGISWISGPTHEVTAQHIPSIC